MRTCRHTTFVSTLVAAAGLLLLGACAPAPPSQAPPVQLDVVAPSAWQEQMLIAVNEHRSRAGAPPLALCGNLGVAAQAHSADQATTGTMSHVGSDGSGLGTRANRAGYLGWNALAENVAAGQPDVSSVLTAWMGSEDHRRNLVNATYTHLGLGQAARSGSGTIYWTQKFGRGGSC